MNTEHKNVKIFIPKITYTQTHTDIHTALLPSFDDYYGYENGLIQLVA